jgi:hypothetical protein
MQAPEDIPQKPRHVISDRKQREPIGTRTTPGSPPTTFAAIMPQKEPPRHRQEEIICSYYRRPGIVDVITIAALFPYF